jgi:succinoglycan biosynthesis protein ExoA
MSHPLTPRDAWPAVSVIMPVLNEARHLRSAVEHVLSQDYPGEIELVMALGPSTDSTDEIAAGLVAADPRVRSVRNPTGRTPAGLNAAIQASRHAIVVRVDGHGILPGDYIRTAVGLLEETGADNVGGLMLAEGETTFEKAVACAMTSPLGVGNARFHTGGAAGPADTVYLGVFRRGILDSLGGYDESFERAQDWELNFRIRAAGGRIWFSPQLWVSYRPRPTLSTLARQYFHYGRWRRVVMRQHAGTVNLRYLAPPAALLGCLAGLVFGVAVHPVGLVVPLGYTAAVTAGSVWIGRGLPGPSRPLVPLVVATMHFAWGAGFLTSPRALARRVAAARARTPSSTAV